MALLVSLAGVADAECQRVTARSEQTATSFGAVFSVEPRADGDCGKRSSGDDKFPWWAGLVAALGALCIVGTLGVLLAVLIWQRNYIRVRVLGRCFDSCSSGKARDSTLYVGPRGSREGF